MTFHFTIRGGPCLNAHSHITLSSEDITCYVGRDKHENEYLIKYGWPGDIWFHVDGLSSAHVYFRVSTHAGPIPVTGIPIDDLPEASVEDMCQIVKHNSIKGTKMASCKIVYTPHSNLKKEFTMDSGTVTYHDTRLCRFRRCDKDRQRIKEIERSKVERTNVDYFAEMKANERRIIERKKRDRKMDQYDPIQEEIHAERTKKVMGDQESGIDAGLAALGEIKFESNPHALSGSDGVKRAEVEVNEPVWVIEASSRMIEPVVDIQFLRARGYTSQEAASAWAPDKSVVKALEELWRAAGGVDKPSLSTSIPSKIMEARQEEKEVLCAIFGEDEGVSFSEDEDAFDIVLPVTAYEAPERYGLPPRLMLEVYVDNDVAPQYPNEPPILAVVGGGLPEAMLAKLTCRLRVEAVNRAREESGEPQIFSLLGFLGEEVMTLVEAESIDLKKIEEEERAQAKAKKLAEAKERGQTTLDSPLSQTKAFMSDAERRSYARDVVSKGAYSKVDDDFVKKRPKGKKHDTGVSDKALIDDMFGAYGF